MLPICDEFSRESIALVVARRMEAKDVIAVLEQAVAKRGVPEFIRSDNGPEFIAAAGQKWIKERGFATLHIAPGSPWENPYSESFHSRFRDELLNRESFASLLKAKVLAKEFRHDHNHHRFHSALDYQTPADFAQRCLEAASAPLQPPQGNAQLITSTPNPKLNQISHNEWINLRGQTSLQLTPHLTNRSYAASLTPANEIYNA